MPNQTESSMIFYKKQGHNHDGENSTKVDFINYSEEDLRPLLERIKFGLDSVQEQATTVATSANDSIFMHQSGSVAVSPSVVGKKIFQNECSNIRIVGTLGVAGSTATTVVIYKNDASIYTFTIPAGDGVDAPVVVEIDAPFNGTTDSVSAKVSSPGAGATELGVEVIAI